MKMFYHASNRERGGGAKETPKLEDDYIIKKKLSILMTIKYELS